jgi:hypothetical protein
MISTQEPFPHAELDYRRERIRSQFAGSAQRQAARLVRRPPTARRVGGHSRGRLIAGPSSGGA